MTRTKSAPKGNIKKLQPAVQKLQPAVQLVQPSFFHGRYIFMVDVDNSAAGKINNYFVNHMKNPFTRLSSRIQRDTENPSLEQQISDKLTDSLTEQKNGSSFCSKNGNGVSANYIYQEFIEHKKGLNWKILINTILYCDAQGNPFAFLMYKNYPDDTNAVYISILCVNALVSKEHYPLIYGDQIINNFKVACQSLKIQSIFLESIQEAEGFWKSKGFIRVDPQPPGHDDPLYVYNFPEIGGSRRRNKKTKTKRKRNKKTKKKRTMNKTRKK